MWSDERKTEEKHIGDFLNRAIYQTLCVERPLPKVPQLAWSFDISQQKTTAELCQYVKKYALPSNEITLNFVKITDIKVADLIQLIQAFQGQPLKKLSLRVLGDGAADFITKLMKVLLSNTSAIPDFPFYIIDVNSQPLTMSDALRDQIIQKIQEKNANQQQVDRPFFYEEKSFDANNYAADVLSDIKFSSEAERRLLSKPIRLKQVIQQGKKISPAEMKLEVVEVEQTEVLAVAEEMAVAECEAETVQIYTEKLIDYRQFSLDFEAKHQAPIDEKSAAALQQELFGNLPHAIKYLTPEAEAVYLEYLPALRAVNKNNLPPHFLLKKTPQGEWVLDFDPNHESFYGNAFTPEIYCSDEPDAPIYEITLDAKTLEPFRHDPLFAAMSGHTQPLVNLWIQQGDQGLQTFFTKFRALSKKHAGLDVFIYQAYLSHFKHWDCFLAESDFITSLDKIAAYDAVKMDWFKTFLTNTGSSKHSLSKTIQAFDVFWDELTRLLAQKNIPITNLNQRNTWLTPAASGNPVVYMERLLCILKNASDLNEQLLFLTEISLENHGAYYASQYENFGIVSAGMNLHYDPVEQSALPFNENRLLYQETIETFIPKRNVCGILEAALKQAEEDTGDLEENEENKRITENIRKKLKNPESTSSEFLSFVSARFNIPLSKYYDEKTHQNVATRALRLIGLAAKNGCIPFARYQRELQKYVDSLMGMSAYEFQKHMLPPLFFVTHPDHGIAEDKELERLMNSIDRLDSHGVLDTVNAVLVATYKAGIKISAPQGKIICEQIGEMNSVEFERKAENPPKTYCIEKLFSALKQHKAGILTIFDSLCGRNRPFIFAIDSAEYLAADPGVAAVYGDNLFLFAGLIQFSKDNYYCAFVQTPSENNSEQGKKRNQTRVEKYTKTQQKLNEIRNYLSQAAKGTNPNNLDYAFKLITQSKSVFSLDKCLQAFAHINALTEFNAATVMACLKQNGIEVHALLPTTFIYDDASLKQEMIALILFLRSLSSSAEEKDSDSLFALNMNALQQKLNEIWEKSNVLLSAVGQLALQRHIKNLSKHCVDIALKTEHSALLPITEKLKSLPQLQLADTFETLNQLQRYADRLKQAFHRLTEQENFKNQLSDMTRLLSSLDYTTFHADTIINLFDSLQKMSNRNYVNILTQFQRISLFLSSKHHNVFIQTINAMHQAEFSSSLIERFLSIITSTEQFETCDEIFSSIHDIYRHHSEDPLLKFFVNTDISFVDTQQFFLLTKEIEQNRQSLANFLEYFKNHYSSQNGDSLFAWFTHSDHLEKNRQILEILAQSHAITLAEHRDFKIIKPLIGKLKQLTDAEITQLSLFSQKTAISLPCLLQGLQTRPRLLPFAEFLMSFEKAPFGARNFNQQFDTNTVERVIDEWSDLNNKGSKYRYHERKKMMEAFLFVNRLGHDLRLYGGKSARELSNKEITDFFFDLKNVEMPPFKKGLLMLALMREAMYRATGQFPYSTQMLALIDVMMRGKQVIANIDTGQGKSLIDMMKASLLYGLRGGRVDMTTSSFTDAERDIAIYSPYLDLLNIPHAQKPITRETPLADFKTDGLNFGTFSSLSLLLARAQAEGHDFAKTPVSLIINESDQAILDDSRTIYRYATPDGAGIDPGNEWIYTAIYHFVLLPAFREKETLAVRDIVNLRSHLIRQAQKLGKKSDFIQKLNNLQFLVWLKSAILVAYQLKEKQDFVCTDDFKIKRINGLDKLTRAVHILMKDGKVNFETQYGDGAQQLLHAALNEQMGTEQFAIERESKTIIARNNANLIHEYQDQDGWIWGSSATVGSANEIAEQYAHYGFAFSKVPSHQISLRKEFPPEISANQDAQFAKILDHLQSLSRVLHFSSQPTLIFFKDIKTTDAFYDFAEKYFRGSIQKFTALEDEKSVVKKAALPRMITLATSGLSRNTDVLYKRAQGMTVIQTSPDTIRRERQKSGRTNRQGSRGDVFHYYNQEDLRGKTIAQIQQDLEASGCKEREFNRTLYKLLGYLSKVVQIALASKSTLDKKTFFKNTWSHFIAQVETNYRDAKSDNSYDQKTFIDTTLDIFRTMLKTHDLHAAIDETAMLAALNYQHTPKEAYVACDDRVRIADCTTPEVLAYHFIDAKPDTVIDSTKTKAQLKALFDAISQGKSFDANRLFVSFLTENKYSIRDIATEIRIFIADFIKTPTPAYKRWLGIQSHLNKVVNDESYLMLFKAFFETSHQELIVLDDLKIAINSLLQTYLTDSWFIHKSRREEATYLLEKISAATSIEDLIRPITQSQSHLLDVDFNCFTRGLKPFHFFGESRLQKTLTQALRLTHALTGKAPARLPVNDAHYFYRTLSQSPFFSPSISATSFDTFRKSSQAQFFNAKMTNNKGHMRVLRDVLSAHLEMSESCGQMEGLDPAHKGGK